MKLRSTNPGTVKDVGGYTHSLSSWESVSVAARLTPTHPGDTKQLGAEFVLGPGAGVSYTHRMITTRGHAPIKDVIRAALTGAGEGVDVGLGVGVPRGRVAGLARERVMSSPGAFNFPTPPTPFTTRLPAGAAHPSMPNLHQVGEVGSRGSNQSNHSNQSEEYQDSLVDLTVSTNTPSMLLGQTLPSPSPSLAHLGHYISRGYSQSGGREPITPTLDDGEVHVVERPQRPPRNFSRPSSLWVKDGEEEAAGVPPVPPVPSAPPQNSSHSSLPYPGIGTDTPRFLENGLRSPTPPTLKHGKVEMAQPDQDFFEIYASYDTVFRDDSYTFEPSATFASLRAAFESDVERVHCDAENEKRELLASRGEQVDQEKNKRDEQDEQNTQDKENNQKDINSQTSNINTRTPKQAVLSYSLDENAAREMEVEINNNHNKRGSSIIKRIENTARSQLHAVYPSS